MTLNLEIFCKDHLGSASYFKRKIPGVIISNNEKRFRGNKLFLITNQASIILSPLESYMFAKIYVNKSRH